MTASILSIHHLHSVKCVADWILQVFLCKYKEVSQSRLFHTTPTTPTISCVDCSRYIHIMKDKQKSDILQFHHFLNARPTQILDQKSQVCCNCLEDIQNSLMKIDWPLLATEVERNKNSSVMMRMGSTTYFLLQRRCSHHWEAKLLKKQR